MLILTRHIGEVINIGDDIQVVITQINGNAVRVGITAPEQVNIMRAEVLEVKPKLKPKPPSGIPGRRP